MKFHWDWEPGADVHRRSDCLAPAPLRGRSVPSALEYEERPRCREFTSQSCQGAWVFYREWRGLGAGVRGARAESESENGLKLGKKVGPCRCD